MGNLVVKDNALIEASHKLGEVEQRLVLLAILKARETGDNVAELIGKELIIHADEYAKTFGINRQMSYKALKKAVMGLYRAEWGYKYINNKGNKVVRYERFTQSAEYIEGEGVVSFKFADAIIPMLVELEKRFTMYEIEQVANLSSSYAMRLYEFCVQHLDKKKGKGWLEISLDELRFRLGLLPTEYNRMGDFKKGVLDLAVKQINENTDLSVSYEQKKQGRTIVGFRFEFKQKTKKAQTKQVLTHKKEPEKETKEVQVVDLFEYFTDLERETIKNRIDDYIKNLESKGEIVSDFHRANITKKAIAERWGLDVLAKKEQKKQKIEENRSVQQTWLEVPKYTKFKHNKDGSLWQKESGCLRNIENGRVLPEGQIIHILKYLTILDEE